MVLLSRDRNPTLKIHLSNGTDLIKFRATEEEYYNLIPDSAYTTKYMTIVGKCSINKWNGKTSPQILIEDYEISDKIGYDF